MAFKALADISSLVQSKIEESATLEYKRLLDKDNHEIAKDISAFANTGGGTIIFGIDSQDRIPIAINWLSDSGVEERIQNIAMTSIQPKLDLKSIEVIRLENPGVPSEAIFVVNIAKSPNAPHMVSNRYYIRRGSVSYPMEDTEVRSAIIGTGRTAALSYEISKNIDLAKRTHELIERVYVQSPEKRQPFALIPFHTDAWDAIVASGVLYFLGTELSQKLVESYSSSMK